MSDTRNPAKARTPILGIVYSPAPVDPPIYTHIICELDQSARFGAGSSFSSHEWPLNSFIVLPILEIASSEPPPIYPGSVTSSHAFPSPFEQNQATSTLANVEEFPIYPGTTIYSPYQHAFPSPFEPSQTISTLAHVE